MLAEKPERTVDYKTMQHLVLDKLRNMIFDGSLKAGDRLRQDELARQLGVSRMPVREALQKLEVDGLVTWHPHRGAIVTNLSADAMDELKLIRQTLEGLVVRLAVPKMTEADVVTLRGLLAQMEEAFRRHDFVELREMDREFHRALYAASRSPQLCELIDALRDRSEPYIKAHMTLLHATDRVIDKHGAILRACEQRDAELAARAIEASVHDTISEVARYMRERNPAVAGEQG